MYAPPPAAAIEPSPKTKTMALLLCLFAGPTGAHRFYVGKTGSGIGQMLTLGGCGIWSLVDLIMILTNKFTDGQGRALRS